MNPRRRPVRRAALAGRLAAGLALPWAASGLLALEAGAADVSIKSSVTETVNYNDNLNLRVNDPQEGYGAITDLSVHLLANLPTVSYGLDSNMSFQRYGGEGATDGYDSTQGGAGFTIAKKTKLTDYDLKGRVQVQPTSVSELEDSGLTILDATRFSTSAGIAIEHRVNQRNSLNWSVSGATVDFSGSASSLTPYQSVDVSTGWRHNVSQLTSVGLNLGSRWFKADNAQDRESITGRITASLDTKLSPRLNVGGSAGVGLVHNAFLVTAAAGQVRRNETDVSFLADLKVGYDLKDVQLSLNASQSIEPSSLGELQTRSSISFSTRYRVNSKSSLGLSSSVSLQQSQGSAASGTAGTDRTLFQITPSYSYRFTRNWNANLSYNFVFEDQPTGSATSNSVRLGVTRDILLLP